MSDRTDRLRLAIDNCDTFVGYHPRKTMADWFDLLGEYVRDNNLDGMPDSYGQGKILQQFEKEIADLLGKEAAVYMPSGTMAQQIALRVWSDRVGSKKVAMHPTSHLEIAEHYSYEYVHHLQRIQWSVPDSTSTRLLTFADFERLKEVPGSVLLELPQRLLGGQLPEWDDLEKIAQWCRERGVRLHLDGARLWEGGPYYMETAQKTLADICSLFDSVYVSFYKGLDGIAGCMLLGPQDFIDESKIWQRRMGGNLPSMFPLYLAARWGHQFNLQHMGYYHEIAKQLAAAINAIDIFETVPMVPQTNMFRLYIRGSSEKIADALLAVMEEEKIAPFFGTRPDIRESWQWTEVSIGANSLDLDMDRAISAFEKLASML
ncbi:MAG: threonine aldolase family protein [Candidatus Kariarchaeaceae archaeon]